MNLTRQCCQIGSNMNYRAIKTLQEMVEEVLSLHPSARNSDTVLTVGVWKKFFAGYIKKDIASQSYVLIKDLMELPNQDAIGRVRQKIQNDLKKYPPTDIKVARARRMNIDEWRVALGYPTKESTGTSHPSYTPPSEIKQGKLI